MKWRVLSSQPQPPQGTGNRREFSGPWMHISKGETPTPTGTGITQFRWWQTLVDLEVAELLLFLSSLLNSTQLNSTPYSYVFQASLTCRLNYRGHCFGPELFGPMPERSKSFTTHDFSWSPVPSHPISARLDLYLVAGFGEPNPNATMGCVCVPPKDERGFQPYLIKDRQDLPKIQTCDLRVLCTKQGRLW